eukprot:615323-Prymnesium_polylepis.1
MHVACEWGPAAAVRSLVVMHGHVATFGSGGRRIPKLTDTAQIFCRLRQCQAPALSRSWLRSRPPPLAEAIT